MSPQKPVNIILGTHQIGDATKAPGLTHFDKLEDVQSLLDAFYNRGYRQLDTAYDYSLHAEGSSEKRLGDAGAPSRFVIHTKVHSGTPGDHEPSKVNISIQKSLEALQTSSVETIFLHLPDRQTPFQDTAKALNAAIVEGKFKRFGLSNYPPAEVQQFIDICEKNGYSKPAVYQGHYNAIARGAEKELFPILRKHGISFIAYSPAAGGIFAGNAGSAKRWNGDNQVGALYSQLYGQAPAKAAIQTVIETAQRYDISGHAVAMRWTAFHSALDGQYGDGLAFGMSSVDQMHKTLDALEAGPLPVDLADAISAVYASVEGSEPTFHF